MASGPVAQSIVREFYSLVQPQLVSRGPWTLKQDRQQWAAVLQTRPLPPLCAGGTFTCNHRQQVRSFVGCSGTSVGVVSCADPQCMLMLQGIAINHVCERFLQYLVDSGLLSQGWRHWPQTWMQEGGEQGCQLRAAKVPLRGLLLE